MTIIDPALAKISNHRTFFPDATFEGLDNNYYILYYNQVNPANKKVKNNMRSDCFMQVNHDDFSLSKFYVIVPNEYENIMNMGDEEKIVSFYCYNNFIEKKVEFYLNVAEKGTTSTLKWNPTLIQSFQYSRRDYSQYFTAISPDKSKLMLAFLQAGKDDHLKGALVMTFDNQGQALWHNELSFEFANKTLSILNCAINNQGVAYFAINSYIQDKRNRTNEFFHLYEITDNSVNDHAEEVNFGYLSNCQILVNTKGDVVAGGYYRKSLGNDDRESGSYALYYDVKNGNYKNFTHKDFPQNYYERKDFASFVFASASNHQYAVVGRNLFEFADGTYTLMGEQYMRIIVSSQSGITNHYHP